MRFSIDIRTRKTGATRTSHLRTTCLLDARLSRTQTTQTTYKWKITPTSVSFDLTFACWTVMMTIQTTWSCKYLCKSFPVLLFVQRKFKRNSHTLTNHTFRSFSDNLNRRFARVANQEQPMNGVQYWPFPSTSATFYRPAELQRLPANPTGPQPIHDPLRTQSPIPLATSMPSPQSSGAKDVEALATASAKTKKDSR